MGIRRIRVDGGMPLQARSCFSRAEQMAFLWESFTVAHALPMRQDRAIRAKSLHQGRVKWPP